MKKIFTFLQNNFYPILVILTCAFLAWKNYVSNTILSGWDTLHPEFNFFLYLKRAFNGVWIEHQGLGAVASQAHPSEIPRLLIIWLLDLALPQDMVRYSFFFLCLVVGALGVYFFSKYLLSIKWHKFVSVSAFLASLFYIFNLTTVQQFYVPLEMFAIHYAFLPWLFHLGLKFLREGNKKVLLWFGLITPFSSSMAHTATLFYAYLACLAMFLTLINFRRGVFLVTLTVLINSFWILPNLYFIKGHSQEVSNSRIHKDFTEEAFLQSRAFGNIESLVLSKNFLFNWREFSVSQNTFVDLLDEWQAHLGKPYVKEIGYVLFILSLLGLFVSIFSRSKASVTLILPFLVSVFFWINSNPPTQPIFDYLRNNFSLFREGLRFPFTKYSIVMVMILSVWFSFTSRLIINLLGKIKIGFIYLLIASLAIVYFQLPSLQGNLVSPSMKVRIPNEYFEVFNWFNNQDKNARVAKLPLNTFWGWNFYSWDYQGAGFTWFGIPQPTLDREFDRWSKYNETFYSQATLALYAKDSETFENILKKYQVGYLLLDESILNAGGDQKLLFVPEIKKMFSDLNYQPVFKEGLLTVYETPHGTNKFISIPQTYTAVNADLTYSSSDPLYLKYGNYIQSDDGVGFPFVNFDPRGPVTIEIVNDKLQIADEGKNAKVILPVKDKITETFGPDRGFKEVYNCDLKKLGMVQKSHLVGGTSYKAEDGGVACDYFDYPTLKPQQAYVLRVKGENMEGRSLKVYFQNWVTNRMDLEELLPEGKFDSYFVVFGGPHTLNIENRSFGRIASENVIESIELYPFDINFLTDLTQNSEKLLTQTNNLKILSATKIGTVFYQVKTEGSGLLELGQGYDQGWLGFQLKSSKDVLNRLEHVKVNSWANGWIISAGQPIDQLTVYLFFWPQLLEWVGMAIGFIVLIYLLVDRDKR